MFVCSIFMRNACKTLEGDRDPAAAGRTGGPEAVSSRRATPIEKLEQKLCGSENGDACLVVLR